MRAIIIGAGIGGLTAGIALRDAGIEPVVFERAAELRAAGAGVVLAANAVRVLGALGLADAALRLGAAASAVQIRSWRGEILADAPAAELERRFGVPSAAIHRADLQRLLLRELGEGRVRLGATCVGFAQDAAGVTAAFADASEARGDVLIGADGLHSMIRARLFREERPRYAGYAAWRAVVRPDRDLLPSGLGFEAWGCGERFGCVPIGGGRVYWFAVRNAPEGAEDGPSGSPAGPKAALLGCFGGWGSPIPELIAATDERAIRRNDIHDRPPLTGPWGAGRVTLLGDAAHPMTPNLGQGACRAIEDAATLARCLAEGGAADPAAALRRYEDRRRARVNWIVRRSRAFGRVGQIDHPLLCRLRDAALKATPSALQVRQLERVIGGGDLSAADARTTQAR